MMFRQNRPARVNDRAERGVFRFKKRIRRVKNRDRHFRLRLRQRRRQVSNGFRFIHKFVW